VKNYHIFRVTGIKISLHQKQDRKIFSKGFTLTAKISVQAFRNVITGNCFNFNYSTTFGWSFSCYDMFVLISQLSIKTVLWSLGSPCFFIIFDLFLVFLFSQYHWRCLGVPIHSSDFDCRPSRRFSFERKFVQTMNNIDHDKNNDNFMQ